MDNLSEISEHFYIDNGKHRAGGWGYKCKHCHAPVYSDESFLPCKNKFVPVKIICYNCNVKFVLKIVPDDLAEVVKH
jgi:hypothetical protein